MHAFPAPTPRSSLERRGSAGCAMQGRSPAARRRARWGVVVLIGWGLGACNGGETLGGPPLAGFAAVAAGAGFACGATPSGVAYCWGDGWYGQLGTGATQTNSKPRPTIEKVEEIIPLMRTDQPDKLRTTVWR